MSPPRGKEGSSRWSSCAYVTMGREKGVREFLFFFLGRGGFLRPVAEGEVQSRGE